MNVSQKKHQQERAEERKRTHIMYVADKVEHADEGWTVVVKKGSKAAVKKYLQEKKEQEEYERKFDYDDDYDDREPRCRGCGSDTVAFEGCCSVRCAKRADRFR